MKKINIYIKKELRKKSSYLYVDINNYNILFNNISRIKVRIVLNCYQCHLFFRIFFY